MDKTAQMFGGRVKTDGVELAYVVKGYGEPVVLISGGVFADAFYPLLKDPTLSERYRIISYHRRGYGSSTHTGTSSIQNEVADCLALIRHLDIERAHIVGHSGGGVIALQLVLDAPSKVHSLSLLEPALVNIIPSDSQFEQGFAQLMSMYQAGDKAGALDAFLRYAAGAGERYREIIDKNLPPGAWQLAVADADTLFKADVSWVTPFRFTQEDAERVKQPVLFIRGSASGPANLEIQEVVQKWLPRSEISVLPGVTHLLQMQNPGGVAEALASFFAKYPF